MASDEKRSIDRSRMPRVKCGSHPSWTRVWRWWRQVRSLPLEIMHLRCASPSFTGVTRVHLPVSSPIPRKDIGEGGLLEHVAGRLEVTDERTGLERGSRRLNIENSSMLAVWDDTGQARESDCVLANAIARTCSGVSFIKCSLEFCKRSSRRLFKNSWITLWWELENFFEKKKKKFYYSFKNVYFIILFTVYLCFPIVNYKEKPLKRQI